MTSGIVLFGVSTTSISMRSIQYRLHCPGRVRWASRVRRSHTTYGISHAHGISQPWQAEVKGKFSLVYTRTLRGSKLERILNFLEHSSPFQELGDHGGSRRDSGWDPRKGYVNARESLFNEHLGKCTSDR